jgi:hypothetical protein
VSSTDYNEFLHHKERKRERRMLKQKSLHEAKLLVACARLQPEQMIFGSKKGMVGVTRWWNGSIYAGDCGSTNHRSHHGRVVGLAFEVLP